MSPRLSHPITKEVLNRRCPSERPVSFLASGNWTDSIWSLIFLLSSVKLLLYVNLVFLWVALSYLVVLMIPAAQSAPRPRFARPTGGSWSWTILTKVGRVKCSPSNKYHQKDEHIYDMFAYLACLQVGHPTWRQRSTRPKTFWTKRLGGDPRLQPTISGPPHQIIDPLWPPGLTVHLNFPCTYKIHSQCWQTRGNDRYCVFTFQNRGVHRLLKERFTVFMCTYFSMFVALSYLKNHMCTHGYSLCKGFCFFGFFFK